jgi:hypothetical protein
MAEEETLWIAAARFEDRLPELDSLEAAGVVLRASGGASVGFSHQTVFEHALVHSRNRRGAYRSMYSNASHLYSSDRSSGSA